MKALEKGLCSPGECNAARHHILHKSWRAIAPELICGLAVLLTSLYLAENYPWSVYYAQFDLAGETWTVPLPLGALLSAVIVARPIISVYDHRYVLKCHHLEISQGLMSITQSRSRYSYEELLGIEVKKSLRDRILGVGTIVIGTAGHSDIHLILEGLSNAGSWAKVIGQRIDEARTRSAHGQPHISLP